ncbi:rhomboid family intramembrane serine protease [Halomonas dongshanensis]|uniref:Rhomboid family intramembrane serine protease n=1 Tax=Halomonas dongshanensis TaxID=2890835 RepID=A0ABT2EEI4_9GAMM|nr:rhomboid family intramembrane serine protease [Halomonas dongshanensis]MCS2609909.1 rhomboid family intramembrane serine protease [Halomonas dongshanensis]
MQPLKLFPHDANTQSLRQALWRSRIGHQITHESEGQLLWLADPRQRGEAELILGRWAQGEPLESFAPAPGQARRGETMTLLHKLPVTVAMVTISLLIFALVGLWGDALIVMLTIVPVNVVGNQIVYPPLTEALSSGQVWRLLSPAFLHFGWMHLVFNLMWVWYFGRQIELLQGSRMMLLLLLLAGVGANVAQYLTGTVLFGGMSGVVYAMLGHVWLMSRKAPASGFFVPTMLVVFMLGWMVFTMTSAAGSVGFGNVANEAHLGGLLVGLATGWYHASRHVKKR